MTLKSIPVEESANEQQPKRTKNHTNKQRAFHSRPSVKEGPLTSMCHTLVRYINKGSKFTYDQIDELIMGMQRTILSLQKKKQELIKQKRKK